MLAEPVRIDPSASLQANLERFKARLTSQECIAVLNHPTFAEYVLSQASVMIEGKRYHVGVELESALRTMRTKLEQMSAKEFDGSNLNFSVNHLPKMPFLSVLSDEQIIPTLLMDRFEGFSTPKDQPLRIAVSRLTEFIPANFPSLDQSTPSGSRLVWNGESCVGPARAGR